jgi:hypothetical protein
MVMQLKFFRILLFLNTGNGAFVVPKVIRYQK